MQEYAEPPGMHCVHSIIGTSRAPQDARHARLKTPSYVEFFPVKLHGCHDGYKGGLDDIPPSSSCPAASKEKALGDRDGGPISHF